MDQAAASIQPIEDLDDLLKYLTEELRYKKGVAFYLIKERWSAGKLLLEKQEYVADGIPYGDAVVIDAKFGDLELRHGRIRVVPRINLWREVRYKIAKGCDVRAIWPLHPPASPPAPDQQPEDKVGLAEAADRSSAEQSPQESKAEGWQISKVREVLTEFVFAPDGRPPTDVSVKAVQTDVNAIFDAWGWKLASRDTVARAMGRRRA